MIATRKKSMTTSLYDSDILLWVEDTVAKLRVGDFAHLDLENLIEEVESLGKSQKRELLSRLTTLLEHLLKRLYVDLPNDYNGWECTIRNQRTELGFLLKDAPSLKAIWNDSFIYAWEITLKTVQEEYPQVKFPSEWQVDRGVEAILNQKFWA